MPATAAEAAAASTTTNYQISDDAIKSLRHSRHSARLNVNSSLVVPQRSASIKDDNKSGDAAVVAAGSNNANPQLDNTRYSNRSSQSSSLWSTIRGRRIYGSAASVASSVTMTEFGGDFSEDFELSNRSLDFQHFDDSDNHVVNNDMQPHPPQRQTSVKEQQSSSMLSYNSDHTTSINHDNSLAIPPPTPPPRYQRSSDLSPKQPGRKGSLPGLEEDAATIAAANVAGAAPFQRLDSKDSVPNYPSRKKSSKILEEVSEEVQQQQESHEEILRQRANILREKLSLQDYNNGTIVYSNAAFCGSEAIDVMLETGMVTSRQEGEELGKSMERELGFFCHASGKSSFCDSTSDIFILATPGMPSPCMLSVRRKTDTSISIEEGVPLQEETAKHLTIPQSHQKSRPPA